MINESDKMMMLILMMFVVETFPLLIWPNRFFVNKEENRQQGLLSLLGAKDFSLPKSSHHLKENLLFLVFVPFI